MTSINALRLNDYSGIMISDVQRSWNPEDMILFVSDKMKPCVPPEIIEEIGLVAAYGNTGTSSIGDEIKFNIFKRLRDDYKKLKEKNPGQLPEHFITIEQLSELVYDVIVNMKHSHISQQTKSLYGVTEEDYIRGSYESNGKKIELNDKELLGECQKFMTWKGNSPDVRPVFLNAAVLAGYEEQEGFKIFQFSIWKVHREPVDVPFAAGGSGSDMVHYYMADFIARKSLMEKRNNIDPEEGAIELIYALNRACDRNFGVGGYYNIILVDGHAEKNKRLIEINDHRAKLAAEIASAYKEEFISFDTAKGIMNKLLFGGISFEEGNELLIKNASDQKNLIYRLRGYKRDQ